MVVKGIQMPQLEFTYNAIKVKQSIDAKPLLLFGAKATEIEKWAGIPQKKTFDPDGAETSGFQRTENKKRLSQLSSFYKNTQNTIQNNLICSLRKNTESSVIFEPISEGSNIGKVKITFPDIFNESWEELFKKLRESLEQRIGKYQFNPSNPKYLQMKSEVGTYSEIEMIDSLDDPDNPEEISSLDFEETHLDDFLEDVSIRHELAKEIGHEYKDEDSFLGFDKESILSFLLPITLVDGQHRLKGAVLAAKEIADNSQEEAISLYEEGLTPEEVTETLEKKYSRELPISLLLEDDPKEQVFQFVVINQKATPIGKSLLGTIISTSLTVEEMDSVTGRLKMSGIELEDARSITWAARNPESPFFGLVERGTQTDKKDLLQWNVMGSLIHIFRDLKGGKLFHKNNDYAKIWKDKYLTSCDLVSSSDIDIAFEEWGALNGVWRDVFTSFWLSVKNKLSQDTNPERFNYWGTPRKSNIFNKISLTILASDFFMFLCEIRRPINSIDEVEELVNEWLDGVDLSYFDRDWETSGVKKDSTGIRSRWSELWADYRENPEKLPQTRQYRNPRK